MVTTRTRKDIANAPVPTSAASRRPPRWLLFVHQLPSSPSNLRVKTWRRMQQLGALAVKQAVYVLPDSPAAREDFEWLKTEIEGAGGEASVFAAVSVDAWSDDALVGEFRRARQDAYAELSHEIERVLQKIDAPRRRQARAAPIAARVVQGFRERFAAIERVDFFGSAGRDRVATLLSAVDERVAKSTGRAPAATRTGGLDPMAYRGRHWVTRPRPGVDRMSSAWLIRRFIDPDARFGFVPDRDAAPRDAIPFDMFGVEFTHRADHCTFETLCSVFGIEGPAISRIAAIVHDLDLKDGRFGAPEGPSVGMVIDGLQLTHADDDELLAQGMGLFEALYRAAEQSARPPGPRVVAGARTRKTAARRGRRR